MSWKAIAFSEAGESSQKSGLTCQDYAQFIKLNDFGETVNDGDIIIGVVSKGSEGYKYSDIGSQLAIETTLNYLQDRIKFVGVNESLKNELLDISKEEAGLVIQQLFLQTVETVNKNLNIKSQDLRCYPQDLSCGLLVVLATPKWLATMRIGDGFIVVQQPDSEYQLLFEPIKRGFIGVQQPDSEYQLLFEPIKQESANKTNFLPANNASELLEFKMHDGQELIFVSTDSLEILAFNVRGESKLNPCFFDSLRQAIMNNSESLAKEIIKDIPNLEELKFFTNTRLTFLLCLYKAPLTELSDCNQLLTQEVNRLYTVVYPFVRENLKKYINKLGLVDVQTGYDEALAVAMFYLFPEFGGDLNVVDIDSVKTRCRYDGQQWSQNVLVVDIGSGTTNIALINFTIKEKDLFRPGENRGAGGRYYIITPKILGSSGNTQLGGDLITLRLFRWLKVAIADRVLTVAQDQSLESEQSNLANQDQNSEKKQRSLDDIINGRELEPFVEKGKYKSGSLLNAINYEQDDPQTDELKAAEKILPTRWKTEPRRLQTFYTLWKYAEDAKVKLAKGESEFILTGQQINEILEQTVISYNINNTDTLVVSLSKENFNRIVTPVIEEAIELAKAIVVSGCFNYQSFTENKKDYPELDRLILSGQTCHLPQVKEQIYQKFKTSNYFSYNPDKITFVPDLAKLIGAFYTEELLRQSFTGKNKASAIKDELRKGANQIEIKVDNLFYFYYLPCSFKLWTQVAGKYITLFNTSSELSVLSPGEFLAKARTDWLDAQLTTGVYREDFPGADPLYWGGFSGQTIANKIEMTDELFRDSVKLQFEIDQKLQFRIFVCQGDAHYLIQQNISSLYINLKENISDNPEDIAVNVFESYTFDVSFLITVVFKGDDIKLLLKEEIDKEDKNKIKTFHYEDKENPELSRKGLISEPLPIFPSSDKHTFYQWQGDRWVTIGQLSKPSPDFKGKYYATLDSQGKLRIHAGEIPYYTSDEEKCLQEEGCVYVTELWLEPQYFNEFLDPFSGKQ